MALIDSVPAARPSAQHFLKVQNTELWRNLHSDLLEVLPAGGGGAALDIGCGPGMFCRMLQENGYRVTGVDREDDMVAAATLASAHQPETKFLRGDAESLPFDRDQFDLVVMTNLLFFLSDPLVAVREMARVCRPGGHIAVLNPAPMLNTSSAARIAEEAGIAEKERWVLLNWARLAEVNGTIDEGLWRTMALLADLRPTIWISAGVSGIGAVGGAQLPLLETSDER